MVFLTGVGEDGSSRRRGELGRKRAHPAHSPQDQNDVLRATLAS